MYYRNVLPTRMTIMTGRSNTMLNVVKTIVDILVARR